MESGTNGSPARQLDLIIFASEGKTLKIGMSRRRSRLQQFILSDSLHWPKAHLAY